MNKLKRSDIKLLSHIQEKKKKMDYMQIGLDDVDISSDQMDIGYAIMEQIETLKQLKGLESSIYNDSQG